VARRRRFIVFFDFLVVVELLARKIRRRMFDIGQSRPLTEKEGKIVPPPLSATTAVPFAELEHPSPNPPPPAPQLSLPRSWALFALFYVARVYTFTLSTGAARTTIRAKADAKETIGDMHAKRDRESARVHARSYTMPGNLPHTAYERNFISARPIV